MDNDSVNEIMCYTAVSVLETAAFLLVDDETIEFSRNIISGLEGASIQFRGFREGRVFLWMSEKTADVAAVNMLGVDEGYEVSDKQRNDVLKEILNMITGNLLTAMFGDRAVFKLCIPEIVNNEEVIENLPETVIAISVEESPIAVCIDLNG